MEFSNLLSIAGGTLGSPVVLFFLLGFLAALARVDLSLPQPIAKTVALYLMLAIGFKGGVGMADSGVGPASIAPLLIGVAFSAAFPILGFAALRAASGLGRTDAAAVAAHYGSISIVTFLTAIQVLTDRGEQAEGILVAVAAAMEAPAIIVGLWLASRGRSETGAAAGPAPEEARLSVREAVLNSSVVVLLGALAIGWITGEKGMTDIKPFVVDPFKGVLCLFLLDMGAVAGRGLAQNRRAIGTGTVLFGLYMPLVGAALMALAVWPIDLSPAGKALLMVLAASASYIAVPAAMRLALPKANPVIYTTLSLGITFPFNVIVGIPLYIAIADRLFAGGSQ
ncbi:sodium-dependent bicarbonate transport family permease [Nisaea acidiphila]|uniref:Sodium-dependent bicarbonate transport family permease n=1 Tax=Nisaea acidiphila TaxID=1862145 RepID=A0A9J7ATF6_9PROT|nr:sodium-dependent bicarbonate transport family permease [Nisaea acidiphila]UUX50583.1 sodium-dependent bicarbonate transport family permease [Nisaea acidiphila]